MTKQGRFIAVEGGEGVGKSAFTTALAASLRERGCAVVTTREPGGTPLAEALRALFASPPAGDALTARTETLLVNAARAQHVERVIKPALARGDWVLCDRFTLSTEVYQGVLGGVAAAEIAAINVFATGGLSPDLVFWLDCPPAVAVSRLAGRVYSKQQAIDRFDGGGLALQTRLQAGFASLVAAAPERVARLDAELSPGAILAAARRVLEARFGES